MDMSKIPENRTCVKNSKKNFLQKIKKNIFLDFHRDQGRKMC